MTGLFARATRGLRRPSLNARRRGHLRIPCGGCRPGWRGRCRRGKVPRCRRLRSAYGEQGRASASTTDHPIMMWPDPLTGEVKRRIVRAFRPWFMNYGLVVSILVSTALVAVLAYRLEGSRWRWPMVALALAGIGTVAGILWIRKYIDRQTKVSDQESKQ